MTLGSLINRLLTHFAPEEREMPDGSAYPGRMESCIAAVNAAMQFLFTGNAPWTRRGSIGFLLHSPTTTTVTVTQGSTGITFDDWQDWFEGCCIYIAGSSYENRIHGTDPETGEITLTNPHDGNSGTVSATVYQDSLNLPETVSEVLTPVTLKGVAMLTPVPSVNSLPYAHIDTEDYGFHHHASYRQYPLDISATTGIPQRYCVDSHTQTPYSVPQPRLRIFPAPAAAGMLEARVRYAIPVYDETHELNVDLPIPHNYCESVLVPVSEKYLTRSPFFRNDSARQAIDEAYAQAVNLLRNMNPQAAKGMRLRPVY